jgi:hypothetical protein
MRRRLTRNAFVMVAAALLLVAAGAIGLSLSGIAPSALGHGNVAESRYFSEHADRDAIVVTAQPRAQPTVAMQRGGHDADRLLLGLVAAVGVVAAAFVARGLFRCWRNSRMRLSACQYGVRAPPTLRLS